MFKGRKVPKHADKPSFGTNSEVNEYCESQNLAKCYNCLWKSNKVLYYFLHICTTKTLIRCADLHANL